MNEMNTLEVAIEFGKLAMQSTSLNDVPLETDGKLLVGFIKEVKEGLDAMVEASK